MSEADTRSAVRVTDTNPASVQGCWGCVFDGHDHTCGYTGPLIERDDPAAVSSLANRWAGAMTDQSDRLFGVLADIESPDRARSQP